MMDLMSDSDDHAGEHADSVLDREARAWLRRLRSGQASGRDARRFKDWCARSPAHRQALARNEQAWRAMAGAQALYDRTFPGVRARADAALRRDGRVDLRRRWVLRGAATAGAAAVVVAAVRPPLHGWPSLREMAADQRTGTGEQASLALSQEVELLLNTQTSIDIERGAGGGEVDRIRLIDGEIAVQRRAGARVVELVAGPGRLMFAPGSAAVRRVGARYCATCLEGSARLDHPRGSVDLARHERVWYDERGIETATRSDPDIDYAWRQGRVVFRATPLREAVEEINRYRPGRVMVMDSALAGRKLSGQFLIGSLDEAIRQIQQIYDAKVTRLPAGVVLLG